MGKREPLPLAGRFDTTPIRHDPTMSADDRKSWADYLDRISTGFPFLGESDDYDHRIPIRNLHVSRCYNCKRIRRLGWR